MSNYRYGFGWRHQLWRFAERPAPWRMRKGPHNRPGRRELVEEARRLVRDGHSKKAISRTLAVPRSTVRYWLAEFAGVAQSAEATHLKWVKWGFESLHQHQRRAYSFLLGMYLGDGYIGRHARAYTLRIFLHRDQREVIERTPAAITILRHVREYPADFLQGCIDSDGSRHRRIVNGKNYPAYSFSNRSEDILGLFAYACNLLGIHWRRASRFHISIARRPDVARLDALFSSTTSLIQKP